MEDYELEYLGPWACYQQVIDSIRIISIFRQHKIRFMEIKSTASMRPYFGRVVLIILKLVAN